MKATPGGADPPQGLSSLAKGWSNLYDGSWDSESQIAYVGGYYSRMFGSLFADLSLAGGYMWQDNPRRFMDNTATGGIRDSADQTIGTVFVTPVLTLGYSQALSETTSLAPSLSARYTFSYRDGYEEEAVSEISHEAEARHRLDLRAQLAFSWSGLEPNDFGVWNTRLRGGLDISAEGGDGASSSAFGQTMTIDEGDDDLGIRPFIGLDVAYNISERFDLNLSTEVAYASNETLSANAKLNTSWKF
ncbi:autotransporter domain-containing protein [Pseudovibrio sp. Tun.PSC04-5.I4]|uniref:autotransporter domain-containing protein n=1 Tax=Pseudovibrio sp. Tun.PSC04-5.I4 TaxID=1798213 RepID=UPI00117BAD82|nr:autotransporter domain-containing protein [Pseudovibrio sp. Tun.PSC04-5.I4]